MSNTPPSAQNSTNFHHKVIKPLKLFHPTVRILGLSTVCVCVFCFFLLDYITDGGGDDRSRKKIEFLSDDGGGCDVFDGDWVWDENYPLYKSRNCRFLDEEFRCSENGRPDLLYTKWRWQPNNCNLPRFDAKVMLHKLRNKRVAFVGDSIGRNQWESLLYMLSSDQNSIYEVNGKPITKHKGFLIFRFRDYNCTVEYYKAPFLVLQSQPRPDVNSSSEIRTTLKVDRIDWSSWKWRDADLVILNTGHWRNHEKTLERGCYFQEGSMVKMEMTVEIAYKKSLHTVIEWIHRYVNTVKTHIFFRTYAPLHFRGGDWRSGGTCDSETLPELNSNSVSSNTSTQYRVFLQVISGHFSKFNLSRLSVLNITQLSSRRKDGHSSLYYLGPNKGHAPLHKQDCSHWCLPGVPDTWNELLYALFLRREATRASNFMRSD